MEEHFFFHPTPKNQTELTSPTLATYQPTPKMASVTINLRKTHKNDEVSSTCEFDVIRVPFELSCISILLIDLCLKNLTILCH